jgi:hypothetical protein
MILPTRTRRACADRVRTDKLRPGDFITGMEASGNYDTGARRVQAVARALEHDLRPGYAVLRT